MIKFLYLLMNLLISVGFIMLLERKLLGFIHIRMGPNKVIFKGLMQFMMDLLKLLNKQMIELIYWNKVFNFILPLIIFLIHLMMWLLLPLTLVIKLMSLGLIILMILMLYKIMSLIILIWIMNNIYMILSVIRMVVQLISFDIIMILNFLIFINLMKSLDLKNYLDLNINLNLFMNLGFFIIWMISILIEMVRLPFDLYESESELITGFSLEFSSLNFVYLILIEYMELLYYLWLTNLFMILIDMCSLYFYLMLMFLIFKVIWIRGYLIRFRLDKIMMLMWKLIFPLIIFILLIEILFIFI